VNGEHKRRTVSSPIITKKGFSAREGVQTGSVRAKKGPIVVIFGDIRWCSVISGDIWWYFVIFGPIVCVMFGDIRWYLVIFGDIWWYLVIFGPTFFVILGDNWWRLMIFGDMRTQNATLKGDCSPRAQAAGGGRVFAWTRQLSPPR
jgi:hypothetical protein